MNGCAKLHNPASCGNTMVLNSITKLAIYCAAQLQQQQCMKNYPSENTANNGIGTAHIEKNIKDSKWGRPESAYRPTKRWRSRMLTATAKATATETRAAVWKSSGPRRCMRRRLGYAHHVDVDHAPRHAPVPGR